MGALKILSSFLVVVLVIGAQCQVCCASRYVLTPISVSPSPFSGLMPPLPPLFAPSELPSAPAFPIPFPGTSPLSSPSIPIFPIPSVPPFPGANTPSALPSSPSLPLIPGFPSTSPSSPPLVPRFLIPSVPAFPQSPSSPPPPLSRALPVPSMPPFPGLPSSPSLPIPSLPPFPSTSPSSQLLVPGFPIPSVPSFPGSPSSPSSPLIPGLPIPSIPPFPSTSPTSPPLVPGFPIPSVPAGSPRSPSSPLIPGLPIPSLPPFPSTSPSSPPSIPIFPLPSTPPFPGTVLPIPMPTFPGTSPPMMPPAPASIPLSMPLVPASAPYPDTPVPAPGPMPTPSGIKGAYWPSWLAEKVPSSSIPTAYFTHIFYAFAVPDNTSFQLLVTQVEEQSMINFTSTIHSHSPATKAMLSIGGDTGSPILPSMVSCQDNRAAFIKSTIEVARNFGFDGLDLDWEFPNESENMLNLALLLKEWRLAINTESLFSSKSPLILSAAVYFSPNVLSLRTPYPTEALRNYLDFLSPMCYNYQGSWDTSATGSPALLYDKSSNISTSYGISDWKQSGAPSRKIVMGIPLYGNTWELKDPNDHEIGSPAVGVGPGTNGEMSYDDIVTFNLENNASVVYSNETVSTYSYAGKSWIGYDDTDSITAKIKYAKAQGLGGYFFWALGSDSNWTLSRTASMAWDDEVRHEDIRAGSVYEREILIDQRIV